MHTLLDPCKGEDAGSDGASELPRWSSLSLTLDLSCQNQEKKTREITKSNTHIPNY